jgi:hypothetical protein
VSYLNCCFCKCYPKPRCPIKTRCSSWFYGKVPSVRRVNLSQNICSFFVLIVPQRWMHRKILTILLCCPKPVSGWKFCNFYWKNVKVRSDDFTARCRIFCSLPLSINLSQNICSLLSPKGGADPKNSDHFVLCPKPVSGWKFVLEKVRSDLHGTIG